MVEYFTIQNIQSARTRRFRTMSRCLEGRAMAKSIQDLRRERGFRSSKEFADALGVSPSSMSRYDKDATLIPVKVAWAMADLLGCSIDEVLGREHVTSGRSELQEDYDALSPEAQALVREFMEFAKVRDKRLRNDARMEQEHRIDRLCQLYERLFYQSLYEKTGLGDPIIFVSFSHEREAFAEFVAQKVAQRREGCARQDFDERDEEVVDAIMNSYDRRHGYCVNVYNSPRAIIEYMGGFPS